MLDFFWFRREGRKDAVTDRHQSAMMAVLNLGGGGGAVNTVLAVIMTGRAANDPIMGGES